MTGSDKNSFDSSNVDPCLIFAHTIWIIVSYLTKGNVLFENRTEIFVIQPATITCKSQRTSTTAVARPGLEIRYRSKVTVRRAILHGAKVFAGHSTCRTLSETFVRKPGFDETGHRFLVVFVFPPASKWSISFCRSKSVILLKIDAIETLERANMCPINVFMN